MKTINHPFTIIGCLLLLFFTTTAMAQPKAGVKANGYILFRGDTVLSCKGNNVIFESVATGGTVSWKFSNGNPSAGSGAGPFSVNYSSAGFDTVFQQVVAGNQKDSTFIIVQVSGVKPSPSFTFPSGTVCGNEIIPFTNTSTATGLSFLWNFKDGTTAATRDATHQFLNAIGSSGTQSYDVSLSATDKFGCADSVKKTVTVKKIPDASIDNADGAVTFGDFSGVPTFRNCSNIPSYNFKFKNGSTTTGINDTYTIDWGDGAPDTSFSTWGATTVLNHTYPIGNKILTVTVKGSTGCTGIKKYNVFLGTNPAGGFSSLGNTSICSPDSLTFVITGYKNNPPGTTYNISVNDGSPVVSYIHPPPDSVSHLFTFTSCGISSSNGSQVFNNSFSATLDVGNPCGSTSISVIPIYVSGKPVPIISAPQTVCMNAPVSVFNVSDLGAVITPTGGNNSTCTANGKQVWQISPATGYSVVSGTLGSVNGAPTNGLLWTNGTSSISLNFSKAGNYTIKMYVANDRCGMDSTTETICVRDVPKASFKFATGGLCETGNLTLNNTSVKGGCDGDKYYWTVVYSDPLSCGSGTGADYSFINSTGNTSADPQLKLNREGQYIIKLTTSEINNAYTCPSASYTDTFFVKGKPKISINPVAQVCVNNGIAPSAIISNCYDSTKPSYKWTFNNGKPATSVDSLPGTVTYNATGIYPVKLDVTNTCGTATATDSVKVINKPTANAGADKQICSGDTTTIGVNTGTGFIYKWSPAVGLSNTAIDSPRVTLTYTGPSGDTTYTYVVVTSAGLDCDATDTVKVKVKKAPVVTVLPAVPGICAGNNILLAAKGATNYTWSPAGTLNSNNKDSVIAKPDTTTTYKVTGSVANGCSTSANVTVTVHYDAIAEFTAGLTTGCTPFDLKKTITVTPYPDRNGTYMWYANGNSIGNTTDGTFPGYTLNSAGQIATIKLVTASNFGCKPDSTQLQFKSVATAVAAFTADKKTGCEPLTTQYSNTSNIITGVQFFWNFGNGITSTSAQPASQTYSSSVYGSDTVYYINLKAYNGCDTTIFKDSVHVFSKPKARFGVDATFGCSPFTFLINNSSYGNPTIYYWDFGNGAKDTTTSKTDFSHTYNTGVLDTFSLQLIAENGCARDTQAYNIIVAPNQVKPFINVNGSDLYSCAPHTVSFNNNSTGATKFTWDFGDNSAPLITTDYVTVVTHTYINPGTYDIKIDVTNGCTDTTILRQATLYAPPTAGITLNDSMLCIYDTVKTVNTSRNADAVRISWGDNSTVSGNSFDHLYALPGTYNITLYADRINNIGTVCSDAVQRNVTVFPKPLTPLLTNIKAVNCAPFELNASAPGIITETTNWYVYDSAGGALINSAGSKDYSFEFTNAGIYRLKLTAINGAGCSDSSEIIFHVYATPVTLFDPLSIATCMQDTTIAYTNTGTYSGTDPLKYNWLVNSNLASSAKDLSYRYTVNSGTVLPAIFNTLLITSNAVGCADTAKGELTVNPLAVAAFTVNKAGTCVPFTLAVNNESKNAFTYQWLLNGIQVSTDAVPQINITQASTVYTLTLIAFNYGECKADTGRFTFTSLAKPTAAFKLNDTLACGGSFSAITTNLTQGAVNYEWNWGDATAPSTAFEPGHFYATTGEYRLQLTADNNICKDTSLQILRVDVKPIANYTVNDTVACGSFTVKFINLSSNSTGYLWNFGDGTSGILSDPEKNYIPSNSPYSVKLTAISKYSCKDSVTKPNIVLAKVPPDAGFTISPAPVINIPDYTFSFLNTTVFNTYYRYLWNLDDGTFSSDRDITHKYNDTGVYHVQLIVLDTLSNCTDTVTKLAQVKGIPGYMYVPNAFTPGSIRESLRKFLPKATGLKTYKMEIYTTWGQKIFETTSLDAAGAPNEGWDGNFNGKRLQQDVYIWKITAFFQNGTEWPGMKYPYSNKYSRVGSVTVVR